MKTFYITLQHRITKVRYTQPVLARTEAEARNKCKDSPYNTFDDFIVL